MDTALLQQIEINKLPSPAKRDLTRLRDWFAAEQMLRFGLRGPGSEVWTTKDAHGYGKSHMRVVGIADRA